MFATYYITWQLIFLPQSCIPLWQSSDRSRGLSSLIPLPQMKIWSWWHRARAQSCCRTLTFLTDVSALTAPSTHLDHSMVVHTERTQTVFTRSLFFSWNWKHFQWYYCWGLIKMNSFFYCCWQAFEIATNGNSIIGFNDINVIYLTLRLYFCYLSFFLCNYIEQKAWTLQCPICHNVKYGQLNSECYWLPLLHTIAL